jgi:hypothetical protein
LSQSAALANVTKPKPRERPVSRSITTCARRLEQPWSRRPEQTRQPVAAWRRLCVRTRAAGAHSPSLRARALAARMRGAARRSGASTSRQTDLTPLRRRRARATRAQRRAGGASGHAPAPRRPRRRWRRPGAGCGCGGSASAQAPANALPGTGSERGCCAARAARAAAHRR